MLRIYETATELYFKNVEEFGYIANYMLKLRTVVSASMPPVAGNFELQEKKKGSLRRGSEMEDWAVDEMTQLAA